MAKKDKGAEKAPSFFLKKDVKVYYKHQFLDYPKGKEIDAQLALYLKEQGIEIEEK